MKTNGRTDGRTVTEHINRYSSESCSASIKKVVPLEAWTGPKGSRNLKFPDFVTTAQDGGKVVSLMHRPPLLPRKYSRYSLLLEADMTPRAIVRSEGFYVNKKFH